MHVLYPSYPGLEPPPFQNINSDNDDNYLSLPHIADWYRTIALSRYGGVWLDASIIMLRPLESWVDLSSTAIQGWKYQETDTMENWALAVPAGSELMRRWANEFRTAWKVGPGSYCERLSPSVVGPLSGILPYLMMHACWRQTRATFGDYPVGGPAASYRPASTEWNQPFGWLQRNDFDSARAVGWLFGNSSSGGATAAALGDTAMIKIRGKDRLEVGDIYEYAARGSYVANLLVDQLPPRPPSPPPSSPPPSPPSASR